ncbi:S8 family serine peptidase [Persicobacter psychrovividus]|uniref:Fibronectin type-III domain-containing protein n=1 Tax=Persicobacter psychrovividus TaxID=387638 RepID=A0ABN6L7J9_9BACT|nr:hypothetical protein PEPS_14700 [Persicobacter psychrovividus]
MRKRLSFLNQLLFWLLLLIPAAGFSQQTATFQNGIANGVVRIKFKPEVAQMLAAQPMNQATGAKIGISTFDQVAQSLQGHNMQRVFPYNPKTEHKLKKHGLHLWYQIEVSGAVDMACQSFSSVASVEMAEPILEKQLIEPGTVQILPSSAVTNTDGSLPTNDPHLARQWHYSNDGSKDNWTAGADVNLFEAWKINTGDRRVIVSIHDEGIDVAHDDLAANMWVNQGEIPGNGIDDDGNGYVDDVHGYSFAYDQGEIVAQSHGTHVAGTVAAVNNNGVGIAGVAGGSGNDDGVLMMSCHTLTGPYANTAASYVYAADNGAVISQNSWGYINPGAYEQSVLDAIDYFIAEAGDYPGSPMKGGIVIFASGNSNADGEFYPGYYENVFTVASTGPANVRAYYSNYGSWVDVSAPGGDTSLKQEDGVLSTLPGNNYGFMQGTSMACPHVSGIAALVLSEHGSENFTPQDMWAHLKTATHSIYDLNPGFVGKLGTGAIDAALALQANEGHAPAQIADLALESAAHDFAVVTFSTPTDEDDGKPLRYEVYYSENTLTANNLESAMKVELVANSAAGEANTVELSGLKGETTYYVAVLAYDRWDNASPLSNVLQMVTNLGPVLVLDQQALNFTIDASTSASTSQSMTLANEGEGLLRWDYTHRQTGFNLAYNSVAPANYPKTLQHSGSAEVGRRAVQQIQRTSFDPEEIKDFENSTLSYSEGFAWYVIGEEDTSLPNSMATKFTVDDPKGFNLTNLQFWLELSEPSTKPIVEIYKGSSMSPDQLIYSKEYDYFYQGGQYLTLDEHFYFSQGESFFVAVHVPAGNLYPLGVSPAKDWDQAVGNQFMSFDFGSNWSPIQEAIGEDGWAWVILGNSQRQYLGEYISVVPSQGEIQQGEELTVEVQADASTLVNGDYNSNTIIRTNGTNQKEVRVVTSLNVTGHLPELHTPSIVNFGAVFVQDELEMEIDVANYGYGNFMVSNVSSSNDAFVWAQQSWEFNKVPARAIRPLKLKFQPQTSGNVNGVITIETTAGEHYQFNVFGVGAEPAALSLSPASQTFDLAVGEETTSSVTIENTGQYPLEYVIPRFADNVPEGVHRFGYSYESNLHADDLPWEWVELAEDDDAVEITDHFKGAGNNHHKINLSFGFPFYGTEYNEFFVSRYGAITFDDNSPYNEFPPGLGSMYTPNGYIYALGQELNVQNSGHIYVKEFEHEVIVEYKNVGSTWEGPSTFQIVLKSDGDFEVRYEDISAMATSTVLSFEPENKQDGVMIKYGGIDWDFFNDKTTELRYVMHSPGVDMVSDLSAFAGLIPVGGSETIDFTVKADGLVDGANIQKVTVFSNDPEAPYQSFEVNTNVSGGEAELEFNLTAFDLGQVYQGAEAYVHLNITNAGGAATAITSAEIPGDRFTHDFANDQIAARRSVRKMITLATDQLGEFAETLTLTDQDGNTHEFALTAEVVAAPAIEVTYEKQILTLAAGDSHSMAVEISNENGEAALDILPMGNSWLYATEAVVTDVNELAGTDFTYALKDNKKVLAGLEDAEAPVFRWDDIIQGGGTQIEIENPDHFATHYELPFDFNFYGDEYSDIYIGINGVISFDENYMFTLNDYIPTSGGLNNFLAPIWMVGGENYYDTDETKGIWVKEYEDKIVITYHRMQHIWAFFGGYASAQVILNKNGTIIYQYQADQAALSWLHHPTVGIENKTGTDGVEAAAFYQYIENGLALSFTPAKKITIPAGASKTINMTVDATNLIAGEYEGSLTLLNNTPLMEEYPLEVALTVEGSADLKLSEEALSFGKAMIYDELVDNWPSPKTYQRSFFLTNDGSAGASISSIVLNGEQVNDLQVGKMSEGFWGPQFVSIDWMEFPMTIIPGEVSSFVAILSPTTVNTDLSAELVFTFEDGQELILPITAMVVEPPVAEVNADTFTVLANTVDHQEQQVFTLSNANGGSVLDYDFVIDFNRAQSADMQPMANRVTHSAEDMNAIALTGNAAAVSSTEDYFDYLYYGTDDEPASALGFGGGAFTTLTGFTAPMAGFELASVQTWYRPYGLENGPITVEILVGNMDPTQAVLVAQQTFVTETSADETKGALMTFELSESVKIMPHERFYIKVYYDLGVEYPQGFVSMEESVANTFFYVEEDGSYTDISQFYDFETTAFMVRAIANEAIDGNWLTLSPSAGAVDSGASQDIELAFDASYSVMSENLAKVIAVSNDPVNDAPEVMISMKMNQAPMFELGESSAFDINEGETLVLELMATDAEGDDFEYTLAEAYEGLETEVRDGAFFLTYATDYEHEGNYEFVVYATDEYGFQSMHTVALTVNDVNRAPEASDMDQLILYVTEKSRTIAFADLFEDLDGDQVNYAITTTDETIAHGVQVQDSLMIFPIAAGDVEIVLVADDSRGGATTLSLEVSVLAKPLSSDDAASVKLYNTPNPATHSTMVHYNVNSGSEVVIEVFDLSGRKVKTLVDGFQSSGKYAVHFDCQSLTSGMYIINLNVGGDIHQTKMIKK